jgi:NADH/NAD ratio-sensing transcriptional regulator Rex
LSIYWRSTIRLDDERVLSSQELANLVGTSDAQTKKDLVYFAEFKIPGQGIG